jgi:4-amino-4-deoxy-L-arabinose transferase-like glycosyltransferase
MLASPRAGLLLAAAWVVLVAILLPVREVTPPDEPRFTHQAQEMKESGDWIVPKIGGLPNADKPPMLFWGANLASLALPRITELTARVPSALGSLVVLLLLLRLGRRLWNSAAVGAGGALVLLTGIEFFQKSQWVSCDMILTAWVAVATTFWREALFEPDEPGLVPGAPRWVAVLLGWVAAAGAVLSKGPVGILWPALWIVAESAGRRNPRSLLRVLRPEGPLAMALIVGAWLAAFGARAGFQYVEEAVFKQNVSRYVSAWNSVQPWYFYFGQAPVDLLPWSLFLPAALALCVARWRGPATDAVAVRAASIFLLLGFAFFSGSSGKRGVYLLPAFGVFSLLVADAFLHAGRPGGVAAGWRRSGLVALAALGLLVGIGAPAAIGAGALRKAPEVAANLGALEIAGFVAGGLALAAGAVIALLLSRRGRAEDGLLAAVAGVGVLLLALGTIGGTAWSRYQGGRAYGRDVAAIVPADARIAVERGKFELVLFYAERKGAEIETDQQFADALARGGCTYAILKRPRYEALRDAAPFREMDLLLTRRVGNATFYLLGPRRG